MISDEADDIRRRFREAVNMAPQELEDADLEHMQKVAGYDARHVKQGPSDDVEHSDWRYSLMNWGHDPLS